MMLWTRFLLSNLYSIVLIALIFLLKKLVYRNGSPRFHYKIWITLLCALLIGVLPVPVFQNAAFDHLVQQITAPANALSAVSDIGTVPDMPDDWREAFTEITDVSSRSVLTKILIAIWAVGVLALFYGSMREYRSLQILIRLAEPISPQFEELFSACCKKVGVKQKVMLRQSDRIPSPLTFGLIHSYVILPKSNREPLSTLELEHILLHELMHIKHQDAWLNFCFCTAQILYWMNPFVWWAYSRMRLDCEIYCDWSVLHLYHTEEARLCYGDTLLHMAKRKNYKPAYLASSLSSRKKQLRYRVERIADFRKETTAARHIGYGLTAAVLFAALAQVPVFAAVSSDFGLYYHPTQPMQIIEFAPDSQNSVGTGCAVVYDMQSDLYYVYNRAAITKRVAPCSTCKIYSALYALEQGILTPNDTTIPWDGQCYAFPAWNSSQDLHSALKNSVNWYFQRLDQAAGREKLEQFYQAIGYGNGYIGSDIAYYWNGSSLKISPLEQVILLVQLYHSGFALDTANVDAVKEALFLSADQEKGIQLYGKTGTGRTDGRDVMGWFVGYVETDSNTYFFAVQLQGDDHTNGTAAVQMTASVLEQLGIVIPAIP